MDVRCWRFCKTTVTAKQYTNYGVRFAPETTGCNSSLPLASSIPISQMDITETAQRPEKPLSRSARVSPATAQTQACVSRRTEGLLIGIPRLSGPIEITFFTNGACPPPKPGLFRRGVDGNQLGGRLSVFGDHNHIALRLHMIDHLQALGFELGHTDTYIHFMTAVIPWSKYKQIWEGNHREIIFLTPAGSGRQACRGQNRGFGGRGGPARWTEPFRRCWDGLRRLRKGPGGLRGRRHWRR